MVSPVPVHVPMHDLAHLGFSVPRVMTVRSMAAMRAL